MNIIKNYLLSLMTAVPCIVQAQHMEQYLSNWAFSRDSASWQQVTVPHDWAINGPFDKKYDLQYVAIEQNFETEKTEKSGRSGALPWIGRGFYRTTINIDKKCRRAVLDFDGAMAQPTIYVNGHLAGGWVYGYNAFEVDITPWVKPGRNQIAVSLTNEEESSRWYPGGGLYRPVRLLTYTGKMQLDPWHTWLRTVSLNGSDATVQLSARCRDTGAGAGKAMLSYSIIDPSGLVVAQAKSDDLSGRPLAVTVSSAKPWSPEEPNLYTLKVALISSDGSRVFDTLQQKVGLRTVAVSAEHGFQLNGKSRKIKGVCLHHDLGPLGAAVNKAALIRQIRTMKDMGCDAIRTAHNMPSEMQMQVCDSMGMMVMAESFDMWIYPKCKNGYAKYFKQWADRDITNLVLRHRNHPSIVMWSIGNEIPEQWSEEGVQISRHLQDLCHSLDPTRPVTQGMDRPDDALKSGFAQVMDVPGFNYRVHKYDSNIKQLPKGFLLGSETASTVSSRGVYKFPVKVGSVSAYPDGQCSSYDTEHCSWSNLPDDDWQMQDDRPWTIGEFVWTGYDYLGEPTPYDEYWPSRSSYFGICDLAGLPKDRYWLYRSHWRNDQPTLHLLPHWTWPGREGEVTPVYCYTSYPKAELFVNGVSQGMRETCDTTRLDRYRLRWNGVTYQPGEIKVVAYDEAGNRADSCLVRTAGEPYRLVVKADRAAIASQCADLAFVTVSVVDRHGNPCPTAINPVDMQVVGAGRLRAACNGDATSLVPFNAMQMPLFSGQMVAVVEGTAPGTATLTVSSPGLQKASVAITVR